MIAMKNTETSLKEEVPRIIQLKSSAERKDHKIYQLWKSFLIRFILEITAPVIIEEEIAFEPNTIIDFIYLLSLWLQQVLRFLFLLSKEEVLVITVLQPKSFLLKQRMRDNNEERSNS